ncbi:MAG: DUF3857 domain-containing protein [Candidatus Acidiferrales bacterium]
MTLHLSPIPWDTRKLFRLAACCLAALVSAAASAAANAPDWLHAAAQQSLPQYPKDTVAVILLDEQFTIVKDNGDIETTYRRAYKILRPQGRDYGLLVVAFSNETRLTYLKAWAIPADGRDYEVKEKDAVETSLFEEELYSDVRRKVLQIPAAAPGNVIGYEYTQKRRPYVLQDEWWFQHAIPVRHAHYSLQIPQAWALHSAWEHYPELKPQELGGNHFEWALDNIAPVEEEPDMPAREAIDGRLEVRFTPRDSGTHINAPSSWSEIGQWYSSLTVSSRQPTPEIKQKAAELTSQIPGPLDKIRALTDFMQRQIRYVAIEIGIGGFQPHPAADVFSHRYGDCKDKATLLSAMLHEIGVESYYVVAQTTRGVVLPDFPTALTFNHVILAIHFPDSVPDDQLFALIHHPKLGRLLLFDPTDPYTPLGYLPSELQDNYGLLVTPEGGELVKMPLAPATANRLMCTAKLSLDSSGSLSGQIEEIRWGATGVDERARFLLASGNDRIHLIENRLNPALSGFTLSKITISNLEKYSQNFVLDYQIVVQNYSKSAGNLLIVRPRVLGQKGSDLFHDATRKYPVVFSEATLQTDLFTITLPPGYVADELPPPVKIENDFGSYSSQVELVGNELRYKRSYEIHSSLVPPEKLAEVKQFFGQIADDEKASAILRRAN